MRITHLHVSVNFFTWQPLTKHLPDTALCGALVARVPQRCLIRYAYMFVVVLTSPEIPLHKKSPPLPLPPPAPPSSKKLRQNLT